MNERNPIRLSSGYLFASLGPQCFVQWDNRLEHFDPKKHTFNPAWNAERALRWYVDWQNRGSPID